MPTEDPWFDETETQKEVRRQAAAKFLIAINNDPDPTLPSQISGFDNHAVARAKFEALGQITLPPDVHVICLSGDRRELAKLVVFTLLDPATPPPTEPYRKHWIAAWPPYK